MGYTLSTTWVIYIIFNGDKDKIVLLKSGISKRYSWSSDLFNFGLDVLARVLRLLNEIKGIQIENEETEVCLFEDRCFYI